MHLVKTICYRSEQSTVENETIFVEKKLVGLGGKAWVRPNWKCDTLTRDAWDLDCL